MILKTIDGNFYKKVSVPDFYKNYFIDAKAEDDETNSFVGFIVLKHFVGFTLTLFAVMFLVNVLPITNVIMDYRKIKKLRSNLHMDDR